MYYVSKLVKLCIIVSLCSSVLRGQSDAVKGSVYLSSESTLTDLKDKFKSYAVLSLGVLLPEHRSE